MAKIRYRQEPQGVALRFEAETSAIAHFTQKQRAITPGQVLALYQDDELIGSGIIEKTV